MVPVVILTCNFVSVLICKWGFVVAAVAAAAAAASSSAAAVVAAAVATKYGPAFGEGWAPRHCLRPISICLPFLFWAAGGGCAAGTVRVFVVLKVADGFVTV